MKWNESKFLHVCSPILEHDDGDVIIEEIQYAHMYKIWYLKHSFDLNFSVDFKIPPLRDPERETELRMSKLPPKPDADAMRRAAEKAIRS